MCRSVETPCARAIRALTPVARIARPNSLVRKRASSATTTSTTARTNSGRTTASDSPSSLAQPVERRQDGVLNQDRDVRPPHDPQVDREQRDHGQDAGQQMQDLEAHVEGRRDDPRSRTRQHGEAGGDPRVPLRQDQRRGDRRPQREAAVHRQVRKIQDAEGQEDAQGHQGEHQPQLRRPQQCHSAHAKRSNRSTHCALTARSLSMPAPRPPPES